MSNAPFAVATPAADPGTYSMGFGWRRWLLADASLIEFVSHDSPMLFP